MPGTPTTKYSIPTLTGSDLVKNGPTQINASLTAIDPLLAPSDQGALASRPVSTVGSPGKSGRTYLATDTGQLFRDKGTGWDEIPLVPIGAADIAAQQAWQSLSLGAGMFAATLSYFKDTLGMVHFRGDAQQVGGGGVSANAVIATMPAGYRPLVAWNFTLQCVVGTGGAVSASVGLDGTIRSAVALGAAFSSVTFGNCHYLAEN